MARVRGFSVVLHDVHKGDLTKAHVIQQVLDLKPTQVVVAEEPYGHHEGSKKTMAVKKVT